MTHPERHLQPPAPRPLPRTRVRTALRALGGLALLAAVGCTAPGGRPSTDASLDPAAARRAAIESNRAALTRAPGDVDARWQLARLYMDSDAALLARAHCDTLLNRDPDHVGALSIWSKLLFESGEHEAAIARLEESRTRQGELPEALRAGLALHYDAVGRWEDSAREFDDLQTPSSAKVYHVLRSDDFMDAGALAEAALERDPASAASHNNYGITQLYAGEPETAHAAFLQALELDPQLVGAMYNLAIVETFYFFDEAAGRDWYAAYRATGAVDDPDGLAETFAWDESSAVGRQARR